MFKHRHTSSLITQSSLISLSALLLAACTTNPGRKAVQGTIATPASWRGEVPKAGTLDRAALERWWEKLQDPVLNKLVSDALTQSPDLRSALSKIAESRARLGVESSGLLPSVNAKASGSGSRTRNSESRVTTRAESYGVGLDASWEIDLLGKQLLSRRAAAADLAQTEATFHAAQVSLSAEVAQTYVNLRSSERQLSVLRDTLKSREETHALVRLRGKAGEASELEVLQSGTSLEQARAGIPALEKSVEAYRLQLTLLCGRAPGTFDELLSKPANVPLFAADLATGIPAETLQQRPDVEGAAQAVYAAADRATVAERNRLPSLSLSGSVGLDSLKAGTVFDPEKTVASLLGSLTAPLFSGGKITQNIRIQHEQTKQALISYEKTVLQALTEVETALSSLSHSNQSAERIAVAAESSRKAAKLALLQYQSGEKDLLTVLDAQRTQLSLEEQLVGYQADITNAHIQLYKALGGGWSK